MWWPLILLLFLLVVIVSAIAIFYGASRWRASTEALHQVMQSGRTPSVPKTYDPSEIVDLPAPVQRYFTAVLKEGQAIVTGVRVTHGGTFNMSDEGEQWQPFTSTQYVAPQHPGFVWDARIRMAPFLPVFVHDAYVAGRGILEAKLLGFVPVMTYDNTPELAQGELMRFLAEGAWYPTALLPSQGVQWAAVDDTQAKATLQDGQTTVTLLFRFDAQGLISTVYAAERYRDDETPLPWQGRHWDYAWREGMLVPLSGEVSWLTAEGEQPYWRGHIEQIAYTF
jgi:hypothetical protein